MKEKISQVIVVEGRDDTANLKRYFDEYVVLTSVFTCTYYFDLATARNGLHATKGNKKAPTPIKERELVLVCVASYP